MPRLAKIFPEVQRNQVTLEQVQERAASLESEEALYLAEADQHAQAIRHSFDMMEVTDHLRRANIFPSQRSFMLHHIAKDTCQCDDVRTCECSKLTPTSDHDVAMEGILNSIGDRIMAWRQKRQASSLAKQNRVSEYGTLRKDLMTRIQKQIAWLEQNRGKVSSDFNVDHLAHKFALNGSIDATLGNGLTNTGAAKIAADMKELRTLFTRLMDLGASTLTSGERIIRALNVSDDQRAINTFLKPLGNTKPATIADLTGDVTKKVWMGDVILQKYTEAIGVVDGPEAAKLDTMFNQALLKFTHNPAVKKPEKRPQNQVHVEPLLAMLHAAYDALEGMGHRHQAIIENDDAVINLLYTGFLYELGGRSPEEVDQTYHWNGLKSTRPVMLAYLQLPGLLPYHAYRQASELFFHLVEKAHACLQYAQLASRKM